MSQDKLWGGRFSEPTDAFVELTVGLTLVIGVLLLIAGVYGKQRWLGFWGVTTLIACAVYYVWVALH